MKLYYSPGACSQAPHIILTEAGIEFQPVKVDLRAKKLEDGSDYLAINPKGAVPALDLGEGEVLTENAVILQFIGDLKPESGLLPPLNHMRRYRVLEWMNFIATELHKGFGPLWNPGVADEVKQSTIALLGKKFDYAEQRISSGPYLMGEQFTLPDAYLFVMLGWARMHGVDMGGRPNLNAFAERMMGRPAVREVLQREGLLQAEPAK